GFIHVLRHERNMRVHFIVAFSILLLAAFINVNRVEWMVLCGTIAFVLVVEMINTAIEELIDVLHPHRSLAVRIIKDISAGTVLVSAMSAFVVGFVIFSRYWGQPFESGVQQLRRAPWYVMLISFLVVIFIVIVVKTVSSKGTPFKGGLVSGHSAIAFS